MMIEEFKTIDELFQRVLPALKTKSSELSLSGVKVSEEEIWKFLSETKWKDSTHLTLFDIVDDILELEVTDLKNNK